MSPKQGGGVLLAEKLNPGDTYELGTNLIGRNYFAYHGGNLDSNLDSVGNSIMNLGATYDDTGTQKWVFGGTAAGTTLPKRIQQSWCEMLSSGSSLPGQNTRPSLLTTQIIWQAFGPKSPTVALFQTPTAALSHPQPTAVTKMSRVMVGTTKALALDVARRGTTKSSGSNQRPNTTYAVPTI